MVKQVTYNKENCAKKFFCALLDDGGSLEEGGRTDIVLYARSKILYLLRVVMLILNS